jgi:hypothetical protein
MVGIRQKLNERGFSVIEFSFVFAVIVLLATAAGLVADKQTGNQSGQLKPNTIQLGTQPSTHNANPTTTTLELNSLDIDITVPNAISNLTYAAPASNGGYGLSTGTLTTDDAHCSATGAVPPLGYFFKEPGKYPGTVAAPGQLVKQFTTFYIAWKGPQTACSTSSAVAATASQQMQSLVKSFDTIEQIPSAS